MTDEEKITELMTLQKPFYSIYEAAAVLGVHERTIRYHIKIKRDLRAGQVGRLWRIAKQDLIDFIKMPDCPKAKVSSNLDIEKGA